MQISKVVLTLKEGNWWVEIPLVPSGSDDMSSVPKWLISEDPVRFVPVRRGDSSFATWVPSFSRFPRADQPVECHTGLIIYTSWSHIGGQHM